MVDKKSRLKTYNNSSKLTPQDISPADDAFHGSNKHIAAEWWYFDANFTNNYSLHIGCRTISKKNWGMVFSFLHIYKDGKLEAKAVKRYLFRQFQTSSVFPHVKLSNNTIIKFDQERFKDKGEWVYDISLKTKDHRVNLKFIGTTKGWKYETNAESWTVALPKASVTGEIVVHGNKMKVNGIGYHDHNWNYTILTPLTYGKAWYWGKITSKTFNVSWAKIMKKASEGELHAVVNQDNKGYFPINLDNIYFKSDKFIRSHRQKIPTSFTLKIDDISKDTPIHVDIQMDTYDIHFSKVLFFPYWRHHVKSTGVISVGSYKEAANRTQIMEYLKFG